MSHNALNDQTTITSRTHNCKMRDNRKIDIIITTIFTRHFPNFNRFELSKSTTDILHLPR